MDNREKVRVVLVHPPLHNIVPAATPEYVDENRGYMPPMGLLYVQSAVEHTKHESILLDANLEGWDHDETARQALSYNPHLIGLQAMSFTLPDAYLVAKAIKRMSSDTKVLFGGPHPTIYPQETARLDAVDFAFVGEGEMRFPAFLDVFFGRRGINTIPGVASKFNGEVSYTPLDGFLDDLDSIHFPARKSSPYKRYTSVLAERSPITTMITSRGCPFKCIFCNRMGRKYRYHSAQYVLNEIKDILGLGIGEIFIHDDTFSINRNRVVDICKGIIERGYDIIWEARTRVDCVDEELLALMRKAGCHRLSFGVESGSEKVLKSMKKGTSIDFVEKVFSWCHREGIVTLADFMFGNLDEELEDIRKTLELVKRIKPDYVQYSICSPYPDTPLYKIALERGFVSRDVWLDFARNPLQNFRSPVWTQFFTEEELKKITVAAYRSFYLRPLFAVKQLTRVKSLNQLRIMLRGMLSMVRKQLYS